MSDLACHCGRRGALFCKKDDFTKLVRWHKCREHADIERVAHDGLVDSCIPPRIPDLFLDTDISRLPLKIASALNWMPDEKNSGLLLHGTTGIGKTRIIWEIIKNMWKLEAAKDRQLDYDFLTMRKLEGMIERSFDERNHSGMIDGLVERKVLVLDDLGKERLTQRMASDLFSIIDERASAKRCTMISTNFNGTTMLDRFDVRDKETGVAIIRRFKDFYKIIGM